MNAPRAVLTAVAAWLVVVVVGSALAWAVISRAGEGVGDPADPATGAAPAATGETPTLRSPTGPTESPTSGAPTTSGSSAPPASSPAAPSRRSRTWQGLGGLVVVECVGERVSLVGAQADSGFHVEVDKRGPERVEVEFDGQGDHDDEESRVRAFCRGGTPVFDVESDDS